VSSAKGRQKEEEQSQVPLSEYKRDEEFPLEKKPWRP
jgi:hypothetical protein